MALKKIKDLEIKELEKICKKNRQKGYCCLGCPLRFNISFRCYMYNKRTIEELTKENKIIEDNEVEI